LVKQTFQGLGHKDKDLKVVLKKFLTTTTGTRINIPESNIHSKCKYCTCVFSASV